MIGALYTPFACPAPSGPELRTKWRSMALAEDAALLQAEVRAWRLFFIFSKNQCGITQQTNQFRKALYPTLSGYTCNARRYIWNHTCVHTHAIIHAAGNFRRSENNFVKSDRQAVLQEFIFVEHRSALVCSSVVRSSLFWLQVSYILTFMIEYFWSHTSGLSKKLVRNLI